MSVIVKGIEMPKNCDECRIMVFEDTNCVPELFCGCPIVFMAHPQGVGHRPDYCPLVEAPKWIPVTERLPEVGKKVLVFAYGNDTLTARMQKRTENGYPVFECNGIFLEMAKLGRITHWMPLPQPPKDGEP